MNTFRAKIESLRAMLDAGVVTSEDVEKILHKWEREQANQSKEFTVAYTEVMSNGQPQRRSITFPSKESARGLRQELIRLTLEGKL